MKRMRERETPGWLRAANRLLDGASGVFLVIAELMIVAMLVMNFANILLRNLGGASLLWVAPWTGVLMVWSVFFAFYVMYRRNLDIKLTFFVGRWGEGAQRKLRLLASLVGIVVTLVIVLETTQILARQRGILELVGLQRYWLSVPLIASSALLVAHFLVEAIGILGGWRITEVPDDAEAPQW
jgi:TRAP-type C4-dicarboxylate transport system permease small subunit